MSYGSNYPPNYGGYGYPPSSGPPPPPGAYGTAYNVNQYPSYGGYGGYQQGYGGQGYGYPAAYGAYGGAPYGPPGGGPPGGGQPGWGPPGGAPPGAVAGFTVPHAATYGGGGAAPPPPQVPNSMHYSQMQNMMSDHALQKMQWDMYKKMGIVSDDDEEQEEIERIKQRRKKGRKGRGGRKREEDDAEEEVEEEEEEEEKIDHEEAIRKAEERARRAEEKHRSLQDKVSDDEGLKETLRQKFVDELMRRQEVNGTFEETTGVVFPFRKYDDPEDPVVAWYRDKKGQDILGEDWEPQYDSEYLRHGMKGVGTNEQAIIDIVATRCNAQRNVLLKEYKTAYGRDLVDDVKSELSGNFKESILGCFETPARYDAWSIKHSIYDLIKDLRSELSKDFRESVLASFETPARYDAWSIKKAIYGLGTNEGALIEILLTRTNAQILEMVQEYNNITYDKQKDPSSAIEKDIEDDTSGDFKRLLISACQGNRRLIPREKLDEAVEPVVYNDQWTGMFRVNYEKLCNLEKCQRLAQELFKAGEEKLGTDEETFNRIFSVQDYYTLRLVWDQYVKLTQRDILNSVDRETSGDFKHGLRALAQNIKCRPMYFAERLYKAMKGAGTDDSTLIRIIISRAEIDMVQIKHCFLEKYRQTLWRFIRDDTSGDYRKLLCGIVGKD